VGGIERVRSPALCEHQNIDAVVIAHGVEDADVIAVQMRRMTLQLHKATTAQDVLWELSQLFPMKGAPIQ